MLDPDPNHWYRAIGSWLVGVGSGGWTRDAADEEGFGLDRLEEDVYVESGEVGGDVDVGDCVCEGGFGGCGGEGVGWVVDDPERHCCGCLWDFGVGMVCGKDGSGEREVCLLF
jgi:hypothetical protein